MFTHGLRVKMIRSSGRGVMDQPVNTSVRLGPLHALKLPVVVDVRERVSLL